MHRSHTKRFSSQLPAFFRPTHTKVGIPGELALGLGQEGGGLLRVDGDEHDLHAGGSKGVHLGGEVGAGGGGEGLRLLDGHAGVLALGHEGIVQTHRVVVVALIEHAYLGGQGVVGEVVCCRGALIGIVEADTERLVVAVDALVGGAGGLHDEHVVGLGRRHHGGRLTGQHTAQAHIHAPVHQLAVGRHSALRVTLRILEVDLQLLTVDAAGGVDLLDGQLRAVLYGQTVVGVTAGQGAHAAQLNGLGAAGVAAAAVIALAAAGHQAQRHHSG